MTSDDQDWLRHSLTTIAPPDVDWPPSHDIRRRAKDRRRRKLGAAMTALVVVIVAGVVIPLQEHSPSPTNVKLRVLSKTGAAVQLVSDSSSPHVTTAAGAETAVARSEESFSLALLRQLTTSGPTAPNVVTSPSSLATALAMLELGAQGSTEQQMASALGSSALTPSRQAAGWASLSADLAHAGEVDDVSLQSANALWVQKGLPMAAGFMTGLSEYFASGVWQVDFLHDPAAATQALNTWVSTQTHGRITSLFPPGAIDASTALILANAVSFKAAWQQPFMGETAPGTFTPSSGASVSVPFMHSPIDGPLEVSATVGSNLDAVQLPYQGGRFAALVLMPKAGSMTSFVNALTATRLDQIVGALHKTSVALAMPSFQLDDAHELNSTLKALGMTAAFGPGADFSGLSPVSLSIQDVEQKTFLKVSKWGTEAAAATGIAMTSSASLAQTSITIDHPFLFLIRDTKTGAILFASRVGNPSQS